MADGNSRGLSDVVVDLEQWLEESKRECQEHVDELTLLQTRGSKLCLAILGPPRVRGHMSEVMWSAVLHHTKLVEELTAL
jgi:hypothetical protein